MAFVINPSCCSCSVRRRDRERNDEMTPSDQAGGTESRTYSSPVSLLMGKDSLENYLKNIKIHGLSIEKFGGFLGRVSAEQKISTT